MIDAVDIQPSLQPVPKAKVAPPVPKEASKPVAETPKPEGTPLQAGVEAQTPNETPAQKLGDVVEEALHNPPPDNPDRALDALVQENLAELATTPPLSELVKPGAVNQTPLPGLEPVPSAQEPNQPAILDTLQKQRDEANRQELQELAKKHPEEMEKAINALSRLTQAQKYADAYKLYRDDPEAFKKEEQDIQDELQKDASDLSPAERKNQLKEMVQYAQHLRKIRVSDDAGRQQGEAQALDVVNHHNGKYLDALYQIKDISPELRDALKKMYKDPDLQEAIVKGLRKETAKKVSQGLLGVIIEMILVMINHATNQAVGAQR